MANLLSLRACWRREGVGRHTQEGCPKHICNEELCSGVNSESWPSKQAFQMLNYLSEVEGWPKWKVYCTPKNSEGRKRLKVHTD